jgi:hypothetical protein
LENDAPKELNISQSIRMDIETILKNRDVHQDMFKEAYNEVTFHLADTLCRFCDSELNERRSPRLSDTDSIEESPRSSPKVPKKRINANIHDLVDTFRGYFQNIKDSIGDLKRSSSYSDFDVRNDIYVLTNDKKILISSAYLSSEDVRIPEYSRKGWNKYISNTMDTEKKRIGSAPFILFNSERQLSKK